MAGSEGPPTAPAVALFAESFRWLENSLEEADFSDNNIELLASDNANLFTTPAQVIEMDPSLKSMEKFLNPLIFRIAMLVFQAPGTCCRH